MAQTSLETFWEQIAEILPFSVDSETAIKLYEKYQEAKQMEREQKEEEYKRGWEESKSTAIKYVEEFTNRLQNETN
jgi:hypothetical protein